MTKFIVFFALTLGACAGQVDSTPTEATDPVKRASCDLLDETPTLRVFAYSDPQAQAPGCKAVGGGVFDCPADYCLMTTEGGTCPHCFGGGE